MGISELNDIRQCANFYLTEYLNMLAESDKVNLYEFRAKLQTVEELREMLNDSIDLMIWEAGNE